METLEQQLERQEENRNKAYDDATGKELKPGDTLKGNLSIGIGWNLTGVPLPSVIIEAMFGISLRNSDADLNKNIPWAFTILDGARRDVFRNLCFNMGITRLLGFHLMIAAANKGDFEEAANQLKDSVWYSQVGDRGVELVEQLRTGQRRP